MIGEDPGGAGELVGGIVAHLSGRPGVEVEVDRGRAAAQPQRGDGGADGGNAADVVAPAEPHAGQGRPRIRREQVTLAQPGPERAVRQERMRSEVGLVRARLAASAATE